MAKKFLALILAGILSCGATVTTFAEEEITTLDYTMIDETVYDGTWVTCFQTFDLYLPTDWNVLVNEDVDAEPENGVYFSAASEDETCTVAVSYAPSEYTQIEEVAEALGKQDGFEEIGLVSVNDIICVSYEVAADDVWSTGLMALGDQGGLYNVTVGCAAELKDDFTPAAANMLLSFSATEEVEEEVTEEAE